MSSDGGPIVCIGASWGGIVALQALLGMFPRALAAPICVVQHRGEDVTSGQLARSLARLSHLTVCEPEDKQPLDPGTVYLAPSGYHLLVEDGHAALSTEERVRWSRPSIDVLFESAAAWHGEDVTAIVLTGANDDGSQGAVAVHEAGGCVFVQDPDEAERREMPQAAIATGVADQVLSLEGIAAAVARRVGENVPR